MMTCLRTLLATLLLLPSLAYGQSYVVNSSSQVRDKAILSNDIGSGSTLAGRVLAADGTGGATWQLIGSIFTETDPLSLHLTGGTVTGATTFSYDGQATPTLALTGTPPVAGAFPNAAGLLTLGAFLGDSEGTYLGIDGESGFSGNLIHATANGNLRFVLNHDGTLIATGQGRFDSLRMTGTGLQSLNVLGTDADGDIIAGTALTTEADTLATVTGRGATTATASTFSGGLTTSLLALSTSNLPIIGASQRLNSANLLMAYNLRGNDGDDTYRTHNTNAVVGYAGLEAALFGVTSIYGATGATTAGASVTPTVLARYAPGGSYVTTNFGVGDTTPAYLLTVGSGDLFGVTSSGTILAAAGSTTTPSLAWTSDTNSGLYSPGNDRIGFVLGGAQVGELNTTGLQLPYLTEDRLIYSDGSDYLKSVTLGSGLSLTSGTLSATGSGGTVTSVGLSLPSEFSVSGSPVTTSGTLTGAWATQSANTVFAGPTSGGALAPTFRSLVTDDLPNAGTAGTYAYPSSVVTDAKGRVTSITAGSTPLFSEVDTLDDVAERDHVTDQNIEIEADFNGLALTGNPFDGVDAGALLLLSAEAVDTWDADGVYVGINAPSGYTGDLIDLRVNDVGKFEVNEAGLATMVNGKVTGLTSNLIYADADGDLTEMPAPTAPLALSGAGVLSISQAGSGTSGYLSSTDWNTFNNKLSAESDPASLHRSGGSNTMSQSILFDANATYDIGSNSNLVQEIYAQSLFGATASTNLTFTSGNTDLQAVGSGAILRLWGGGSGSGYVKIISVEPWMVDSPTQTTVGAAGAASAPPATPVKYLKIKDSTGTTYAIPLYNS